MRASSERGSAHRPRKRFGQHFLEPHWAEKVVSAMAPAASDTVLEIGPGRGAITYQLAERVADLLAFEIDRDLAAALRSAGRSNLRVVEGDFLNVTPAALRATLAELPHPSAPVRVAGNLPYNVASPILFKLVELSAAGLPLADATVMLQREVAERLLAPPDTKEYGVLSVLIRHRAEVTRLLQVPAGAFRPPPKVLSTVVRLTFHPPSPPVLDEAALASLVQAVFTRRRKTLSNALVAHHAAASLGPDRLLEIAGIDGRRRPETLSIEEFARLADEFTRLTGGRG